MASARLVSLPTWAVFGLPLKRTTIPPSWVYIELNDRQTNTKYKSNLADTGTS